MQRLMNSTFCVVCVCVCVDYFMTLSISRLSHNGKINDELQRIWKEAIVTNIRTILEFPEGTEGNLENHQSG
jgi:hypothetical protein